MVCRWLFVTVQMAVPCTGVVGTFQYSAPTCKEQNERDSSEEDPQARCVEKSGRPDELHDICPKCNDEIVWIRKRIDVSQYTVYQLSNNRQWGMSHTTFLLKLILTGKS